MNDDSKHSKSRQLKDAIVEEVFAAYREVAALSHKSDAAAVRDGVDVMRHGCELILCRLFPLSEPQEKIWEEIRSQFRA